MGTVIAQSQLALQFRCAIESVSNKMWRTHGEPACRSCTESSLPSFCSSPNRERYKFAARSWWAHGRQQHRQGLASPPSKAPLFLDDTWQGRRDMTLCTTLKADWKLLGVDCERTCELLGQHEEEVKSLVYSCLVCYCEYARTLTF